MAREKIPSERPDGLVDVATIPEGWLVDEAWRPGKTWLSAVLEADPEAWVARLTQIAMDVQMQLAERNAVAKATVVSPAEAAEYQEWRSRALALLKRVQARGQQARLVRKQVRVATTADATRAHVAELRRAIEAHKAASQADGIDPEPHDLALWASLNM